MRHIFPPFFYCASVQREQDFLNQPGYTQLSSDSSHGVRARLLEHIPYKTHLWICTKMQTRKGWKNEYREGGKVYDLYFRLSWISLISPLTRPHEYGIVSTMPIYYCPSIVSGPICQFISRCPLFIDWGFLPSSGLFIETLVLYIVYEGTSLP